MRKSALALATVAATFFTPKLFAAPLYWDLTDGVAGSGGPTPSGTFNSNSWNTVADGTGTLGAFTSADIAVFSAGSDATGAFTINLTAAQTAAGVIVEEGIVSLTGSGLTVGAGTVSIASGATLSIPSTLNLVATAGANLNLDGGTIRSTTNGAGSTFVDADFTINVGAAGGTVATANTGTNSAIFGGANGGTIKGPGILTKTGSGEFRYQGIGLPNTTYSKLVVNEGLFRLGFNSSISDERGFGAVPADFTPDAITLSGGGSIGTSFTAANSVLHANRGITLGPGGGGIFTHLTVPGAITGSGSLTTGNPTTAATVNINGLNTFTGGVTVISGTTAVGASGGLIAQSVNTTGTTTLVVNGVVSGSGAITKTGTGILTLAGSNSFSSGIDFSDGRINFNHNSAAGSGSITVGAGADEFTNTAAGITLANDIMLSAGANPKIYSTSGNSLNITGIISGSGSLLRDDNGAGTLAFSGANTYSGGFKITSRGISIGNKSGFGTGTLTIGDAVTAPANAITITATTDLSGVNAVTNAITLNQNFTTTGSNLEFSANIDLGAATRTITANNTAGSATILSGSISGVSGALTKAGTGTVVLSGTANYDGATTISTGTLLVSGNLTGTSLVAVSGTLGGTGTIAPSSGGNINVLAGGILSPGASIGTLTANLSGGGKLDISAGVTASNSQSLVFELGLPATSDKFSLSGGALEIGSGVLEFDDFAFAPQAGFSDGFDYVLFDGTVPISGTFGANLTGMVGEFTGQIQLADGGNDIVLHVVPEPSAAIALLGGAATLLGLRRRRS